MFRTPGPALGTKCEICNTVPMTDLSESAIETTGEALPLGPQSLVWRYFGDNRMFLIGPRPAVLQNMLAELGQGVLDHSVFFDDTSARIKRSLPPIFKTVYGSDDDNTGQQVRDFHHQIKGFMPPGQGKAERGASGAWISDKRTAMSIN